MRLLLFLCISFMFSGLGKAQNDVAAVVELLRPQTYYGVKTLNYFIGQLETGENISEAHIKAIYGEEGSKRPIWLESASYQDGVFQGIQVGDPSRKRITVEKEQVIDWLLFKLIRDGEKNKVLSFGGFSDGPIYIAHKDTGDPLLDNLLNRIQDRYFTEIWHREMAKIPREHFEATDDSTRTVFVRADPMPTFPGGRSMLAAYLGNNIHYPEMAREAGVGGRVNLSFVISKSGRVSNIRLHKRIGGGCDEEAIRVIENMPRWIPGRKEGKPVAVEYYLPLNFGS